MLTTKSLEIKNNRLSIKPNKKSPNPSCHSCNIRASGLVKLCANAKIIDVKNILTNGEYVCKKNGKIVPRKIASSVHARKNVATKAHNIFGIFAGTKDKTCILHVAYDVKQTMLKIRMCRNAKRVNMAKKRFIHPFCAKAKRLVRRKLKENTVK